MDPDYYKDTTHFSPQINDWMVECFVKEDYIVTDKNIEELQQNLINNTETFRKAYLQLLVK